MSFECAFRVQGRLSPEVVAALEPLRQARAITETELRGVVSDQAALHGLLARFDALGVEIIEFIRLPSPE
ncbi:MAG TPA: hypothetical protein VKZ81_21740 [Pseudonocardia sp.]|uniref:hypothetical protein n=1 Tax=Pseudonocardia sp. TaxID=60912 RepID=UPI002B4B0874|nr:hypothetical protein [Pseudonocardia sp.]HLU58092.1 hypothetical protein [Pseudonocardia sp.]